MPEWQGLKCTQPFADRAAVEPKWYVPLHVSLDSIRASGREAKCPGRHYLRTRMPRALSHCSTLSLFGNGASGTSPTDTPYFHPAGHMAM